MKATTTAVLAACAAAFALSGPVKAQSSSYTPGTYWEVSMIKIEDGQSENYLDYLAAEWKHSEEFAKSKGYIREYHVLENAYPRDDEPDLYLITVSDRLPDAAEQAKRQAEFEAFMKRTSHQLDTESGHRTTMRHLKGSMLLQELNLR